MKKTYIAILVTSIMTIGGGVAAAPILNNGNSFATEENVSELNFTLSHMEAGVAQGATATPQITVNQNNSYFISGYKTVSFTNGDDVVLDDDNISKNKPAVLITNGKLSFDKVQNISFGTSEDDRFFGAPAFNVIKGELNIGSDSNVVDNFKVYVTGNGIVNQGGTGTSSGSKVSINANNVVLYSKARSALLVSNYGDLSDKQISTKILAQNVMIRTDGESTAVGVVNYGYNNSDFGSNGDLRLEINADKDIAISSALGAAVSTKIKEGKTAKSTNIEFVSKNGDISIDGGTVGLVNSVEKGTAASQVVEAKNGSLSISGKVSAVSVENAQTNLISDSITLKGVGSASSAAEVAADSVLSISSSSDNSIGKTAIIGDVNAEAGTVELHNQNIDLSSGSKISAGTMNGENSEITLHALINEGKSISLGNNKIDNLRVKAAGDLNDTFAANPDEAVNAILDNINIGGSNDYTLIGEAGALSDSWISDKNGNITSRKTNQSLDAFGNYNAMTLVQWRNEVNHISQRLGDVRDSSTTIGAWARVYGYDSSYDDNVSIDFKANSIQAGGDYRINNTWLVGGAFSYTDGEGKFSNGSADSDGYSLAAYLSGFFDCGGYVDFVGRIGRLSTDITAYSDASEFKGSYNNTTFGLSAEVGYHWKLNDTFYVEPQAELAYGFVKGDDFTGANDVRVEQDDFQTLVGRLGARIGASFADGAGTVYAHASVNHDFLGDADYTASLGSASRDLSVDIGGTWVSYGIGAQFNTTKNLNFYSTLEGANGSEYQEDYRYSVGMSYRF